MIDQALASRLHNAATYGYLVTTDGEPHQLDYRDIWITACRRFAAPFIEVMQQPQGFRVIWYGNFQPAGDADAVRAALDRYSRKHGVEVHFKNRTVGVVLYLSQDDAEALASQIATMPSSKSINLSAIETAPAS